MSEEVAQTVIDEATADLTDWMLEWGWIPALSKDQVRMVCGHIVSRVLVIFVVVITLHIWYRSA